MRQARWIVLALSVAACGDAGGAGGQAGGGSGGAGGQAGGSGGAGGGAGSAGSGGAATGGGGQGAGGQGQGGSVVVAAFDFQGADGSAWPAPWVVSGGVDVADLQQGRGRFTPTVGPPPYPLARMHLPASESDVEATFVVTFTSAAQQGCGFYARQNGGHLQSTAPPGRGHAVFVTNAPSVPQQGISLWTETGGVENGIVAAPFALANGTPYRVRFRVEQLDATSTALRARIWADGAPEPAAWMVETVVDGGELQGVADGFAFDSYYDGAGVAPDLFVDDVHVERLP